MTARVVALAVVAVVAMAGAAEAATRRIVLVAGANTGLEADRPLAYAERDAARVAAVFREIGQADRVEELVGADARQVLAAFTRLGKQIDVWKRAGDTVVFLFYYSGHGNERGLRMSGSELSTETLLASLQVVGADLRLAVIDACESGTFTRKKGVTNKRQTTVQFLDRVDTRGEVVLASTSQGEAAQESEVLKGSFFTSYWLTGLRGAADTNGDGVVGLQESYAYAYDRTLVSTVITSVGIQHPTFRSTVAGRRDLSLTWPKRSRAHLRFRARTAGTFLVLSAQETSVLAEVPAQRGVTARIALAPGTYVVKKRGADGLQVAMVHLRAGSDAELDESEMRRVPYAVLVEKGARESRWITASLGATTRLLSTGPGISVDVGYMRSLGPVVVWPTLGIRSSKDVATASTINDLRPAVALVGRRQRPRWETHYGIEVAVPIAMQDLAGETRFNVGAEGGGLVSVLFGLDRRTSVAVTVRAGARAVRSAATAQADAQWQLEFRESVQAGVRVLF